VQGDMLLQFEKRLSIMEEEDEIVIEEKKDSNQNISQV
jgi:hypothetical protein